MHELEIMRRFLVKGCGEDEVGDGGIFHPLVA